MGVWFVIFGAVYFVARVFVEVQVLLAPVEKHAQVVPIVAAGSLCNVRPVDEAPDVGGRYLGEPFDTGFPKEPLRYIKSVLEAGRPKRERFLVLIRLKNFRRCGLIFYLDFLKKPFFKSRW